jgi:peptide/nickel transport system permease protein
MAASTADVAPVARPPSRGAYAVAWQKLRRHRLGMIGLIVLVAMIVAAILAPVLAPHDPTEVFWEALLAPPSWQFPLGTDEIGRDILSRLIFGARISLQIVIVSIVAALVVGASIGLVSGYAGGRVDSAIMRIMDGLLAFPLLILALGIIAVLGPSLINAMIAIGVVNVPGFARLVRGQVLSVRELDFVQAARALGGSHLRIMARHIWPSVAGNVIVYASLRASAALITESSLAFLGLGAEPPTPTWGQMLATAMQYWDAWWLSVFPGLAIFVAALAFNFLGDGLRDALDARIGD